MTAWLFTIRVSPGMLVLGGGFEPSYLAIISRVPIPNWRPQHSLRADGCQPYYGVPAESRTPDTMIKSHVLYLLSYRHILWRSVRDLNTELQVLQTAALPFDQPTILAERVGFELTLPFGTTCFPNKPLSHLGISPFNYYFFSTGQSIIDHF